MEAEKTPTVRDLLDRSRSTLASDLKAASSLEEGVRRRIRRMAENGDLALIGSILDWLSREESMAFLSYASSQDVEVLRGKIIGFRQFFQEILDRGDYPDQRDQILDDDINPFRVSATINDNPFVVNDLGLTRE